MRSNPSRTRLASCSDDRTARIWNIEDIVYDRPQNDRVLLLKGHREAVSNIAWCPFTPSGEHEMIVTLVPQQPSTKLCSFPSCADHPSITQRGYGTLSRVNVSKNSTTIRAPFTASRAVPMVGTLPPQAGMAACISITHRQVTLGCMASQLS